MSDEGFPWRGRSNGQTAMAQSSTESEMASLNEAISKRGEPVLTVWSLLLSQYHGADQEWKVQIKLHEGNTACILGARVGKNPSMEALERNC